MNHNPSKFKSENRPVEMVSWNDAIEFCDKLTEIQRKAGRLPEGMVYSLPTEAQWEYACRAGTTTAYSWGDEYNSSKPITTGIMIGRQTNLDVGQYVQTHGAFLICTEMCGSGRRTGTQHTVREHRLILRVRLRAPTVSFGAAPGTIRFGPAFGLPRLRRPQLPQQQHSASVSVSNSSKQASVGSLGSSMGE